VQRPVERLSGSGNTVEIIFRQADVLKRAAIELPQFVMHQAEMQPSSDGG